jgi:hypothetical protein
MCGIWQRFSALSRRLNNKTHCLRAPEILSPENLYDVPLGGIDLNQNLLFRHKHPPNLANFLFMPQERFRVAGLKRRKPDPIAQKSAAVPSEAEDYR